MSALDGVKVLDLSRLLPGGFCSLLMADFGADVLKVEDTGMGDYVRWAPPLYEGAEPSAASALFLALNRGKRSIRLNLKEEAGREVLLKLVKEYDVLLESFRPGVLDRLGVGYERLREENPGLVYCAISGYGQDGPYRDRSGHDMNYLGLVGVLGLTGEEDGPPIQAAGQIADLGGGALMAAFGILAALRERDRSGEGQFVDISMADGSLAWMAMVAARHLAEGNAPEARRPRAGRRVRLLPPLRVQGRLGHPGRARAEVLAGLVPGRGARGPDREPVRAPGLRRPRRGGARVPRAHARRVAGVRLQPRLLPGAGAGAGRGAGVRARARARDGGRGRSAGRREAGAPGGQPGEDGPHPGRRHPSRARCSGSTPPRCWRGSATARTRSRRWRRRARWAARSAARRARS